MVITIELDLIFLRHILKRNLWIWTNMKIFFKENPIICVSSCHICRRPTPGALFMNHK
jgi:hypothetical protein